MPNHDDYEESYLKAVEDRVDRIREKALMRVRESRPDIDTVIDRRTIDDYCYKQWDYPGKWYVGFKLPDGFKDEEALIKTIVDETLLYFPKKKKFFFFG